MGGLMSAQMLFTNECLPTVAQMSTRWGGQHGAVVTRLKFWIRHQLPVSGNSSVRVPLRWKGPECPGSGAGEESADRFLGEGPESAPKPGYLMSRSSFPAEAIGGIESRASEEGVLSRLSVERLHRISPLVALFDSL